MTLTVTLTSTLTFRLLEAINANPQIFSSRTQYNYRNEALEALGLFLGADVENLAFIENVTQGE